MKIPKTKVIKQTTVGLVVIGVVVIANYLISDTIDYRITAIVLLFMVSIFASIFEIVPVLILAIVSALSLNFFFIPPIYTFHIQSSENILLFLVFFGIAIVNAVLTSKIRKVQEQARDQADKEKSLKLYGTLFNSLSHELKTPISTIIASTDILVSTNTAISNQNRDVLLDQIAVASNRLNIQVNNLLNMSRLETGMLQLNKSWCDVNDLINNSINSLDNINGHSITFVQNESLPLILVDAGILDQVMINIFNNALIHTNSETLIIVSATLVKDTTLNISIEDNGPGVELEKLPFLFDKFYKTNHATSVGSGLGLSIVKGYIEAMSGSVIAKNIEPHGLNIVTMIPVDTSYINKLEHD